MDQTTLYARTTQGNKELEDPGEIRGDLARMLATVDGKAPVADLGKRLPDISPAALESGLAFLVAGGYIAIPYGAPGFIDRRKAAVDGQSEQQRRADDLRAKLKARREGGSGTAGERRADEASGDGGEASRGVAEETLRREIEEAARREAEAKVRREYEEKARREAEERARREAEETQRREIEERARREAEEKVRREMEEQARAEAEEKARAAAAERAWREAEEKARIEAEEKVRREAEEKVRREQEERARRAAAEEEAREAEERAHRAEVQARLLAEEQAWHEAEERARLAEEEAARNAAVAVEAVPAIRRPSGGLGKKIGIGVAGLLVVGLAALHVIPFGGQIPAFEAALAAQFREPVKIDSLHVALVPQPHLRLDGIRIGADGRIRIASAKAFGDLGNLFSPAKNFKSIRLDSPVIAEQALGWLVAGPGGGREFAVGTIDASNVTVEGKTLAGLSPFDARLAAGDGGWTTITFGNAEKTLEGALTAKGKGVQLEIKARSLKVPFGSTLVLEDFSASGSATAEGVDLAEFKGFSHGGTLAGTARLRWGNGWTLAGEVNARQIDMARVVPELMGSARLAGSGSYSMQAADAAQLFPSARLEGSFSIPRGTLLGIDLGSVLQGGDIRGQTQFTELAGSLLHERGVTQFRQLRLNQANLNAGGTLDVDAERRVRGRVSAEIRLSTEQRRVNLGVSGTLSRLEWQRQ